MSNIQFFFHPQFGNIRIVINNYGVCMFVANDVAKVLGYEKPQNAVLTHCKRGDALIWDTAYIPHKNGVGGTSATIIGESNLYRLIMRSQLPEAEKFQDWVCEDVLPSIRKHGMYATAETVEKMLSDPDNMIKVLTVLKDERQAKERAIAEKESLQLTVDYQSKDLRIQSPKVEYHDKVLQSDGLIATTTIAKELGMSAVSLNKVLHNLGIIYKSNGTWVLYAKYQNKGYTGTKTTPYTDSLGHACTSIQTYWTEKGRKFIHELSKTKISA